MADNLELLLDVGNTHLKWGWFNRGSFRLEDTGRILHLGQLDTAVLSCRRQDNITPSKIIAANVAGADSAEQLSVWAHHRWQQKINFMSSQASHGHVVNAYDHPEKLGVDRWATLIAAHQDYPDSALLIVDCGTAITLDVMVNTSTVGRHLGGLILPGIRLMKRALLQGTAGIVLAAERQQGLMAGLANNTTDAIFGGIEQSIVATIERVHWQAEQHLGMPVQCLMTGGDGEEIAQYLAIKWAYEAHLVLLGLAYWGALF